jgi:hypothetical protein
MASVFKAYHPALDRFVAIKVLHPAFKEEPNFLSRFQREARVVARLEHPNIVPVYDFAEHEGQPYLVMKYIEGETLKARLNQGPLTKKEALSIVEAVGSALTYAHQRGVLHRDIKPSNVLLSHAGSIYLADFGLARMVEAGASTLSKDVMLGTPQYVSPEQAKGNIELGVGTDIYSFGVVLYELVVGRVPFNADTPFSIIHDHIYTPLPLPSEVNPKVPEVTERVLLKSLAKEPADRFKSVEALVSAFHAAVVDGQLPADVETVVYEGGQDRASAINGNATNLAMEREPGRDPGSKEGKKRRWPWIVVGLGSSVICLFLFLLALGSADREDPAPVDSGNPPAVSIGASDEPIVDDDLNRPLEVLTNPEAAYGRAEQLASSGRNILAAQAFIRAGDLYLRDAQHIEAAQSYLRALDLDRAIFEEQDEVVDRFTQAAFLGAESDRIWPIIDQISVEAGDWPLLQVITARAHLFNGEFDITMPLLDDVLRAEGDLPLAMTVKAEFELLHGDAAEAQRLLDELLADPERTPTWLIKHLNQLAGKVQ